MLACVNEVNNIIIAASLVMEYGEGKTGCYRILIKGYQWIWATTRSYISFNHWNSKPEIYCSTTKVIRLVFEEPFFFFLILDSSTILNQRPSLVSAPIPWF